jgi:hypothetical protein
MQDSKHPHERGRKGDQEPGIVARFRNILQVARLTQTPGTQSDPRPPDTPALVDRRHDSAEHQAGVGHDESAVLGYNLGRFHQPLVVL